MSNYSSSFSNCGCPTSTPTAGFNGNPFSPENIKIAYESNPDTNAFTNADKEKLNGLEEGVKAQVLNLTDGTNTMGQEIIMASFTIQELGDAVNDTDAINLGQTKQLIKDAPNSTTFVQEDVPDVLTKYETIGDAQGATWFIPSENSTYVYYVDPNGTGQWVEEDSVGDDGGSSFNFTQEEVPTENLVLGARWFKPSTSQEFIYYIGDNDVGVWTEANDTGDSTSAIGIETSNGGTVQNFIDRLDFSTVENAVNYNGISGLLGYKIYIKAYREGYDYGGAYWEVVQTADVIPNDIDIIQSNVNPSLSIKLLIKRSKINVLTLGFHVDGTDDSDRFARAKFLSLELGRDIFFPRLKSGETYKIDSSFVWDSTAGVTIRGEGSKLKSNIVGANLFHFSNSSNVTVKGLDFNLSESTGGNTWQGSAVFLLNCSESKVNFNRGYNGKRAFIGLQNSSENEIKDNVVYNSSVDPNETTTDWGVAIFLSDSSSRNQVIGNIVKNCATAIAMQSINLGTNPKENIVTNNTIIDCYVYGILAYRINNTDGADNNVISNNIIKGIRGSILNTGPTTPNLSFGAGIYLQGASNCTVSGNYIENTNQETTDETLAPAAIGMTNTTQALIYGNTINSPQWYGIAVFDPLSEGDPLGVTTVAHNKVFNSVKASYYTKDRDNVLFDSNESTSSQAQGFRNSRTDGQNSDNMTYSGCKVKNSATNAFDLNNLRDSSISNSDINGCATGIYLNNSARVVGDCNIVSGATIRAFHTTASSSGISLDKSVAKDSNIGFFLQGETSLGDFITVNNTTDFAGEWSPGANDDNTATPNAASKKYISLVGGGANVTYLTNGKVGQRVVLYSLGARTIVHGTSATSIRLNGSIDFVMAAGSILELIRNVDGRWDEVSRKIL